MAIGRGMKRTFRGNKKTDNEWSDHSKSMRSAGGTSNTREVRSAIKNTARSFATPMRTPSVARSGYAKKLRTQELRGKSQISYKKPNTTALPTPTMTSSISRANSRPLQQKSTRSIGMEEPTPRSAGSGYTQKVASKAYLKTARNGGEEGKENAKNRTGRIARADTYTGFVKSKGYTRKTGAKARGVTRANKSLLDRYRGK